MFGWLFGNKKEVERVEEETRKGFEAVKQDIESAGKWIKHLNTRDSRLDEQIEALNERLSTIESELENLQNVVSLFEQGVSGQVFKQRQTAVYKQTAVQGVQTPVQTGVQTGETVFLNNLSVMEKAIVYLLLNSEMKLSYEDIARMLGKDRATVRGHINRIRQKNEGLIEESIERNGKKRLHIPEEVRVKLLKKARVRERKEKEYRREDQEEE